MKKLFLLLFISVGISMFSQDTTKTDTDNIEYAFVWCQYGLNPKVRIYYENGSYENLTDFFKKSKSDSIRENLTDSSTISTRYYYAMSKVFHRLNAKGYWLQSSSPLEYVFIRKKKPGTKK